MEQNMQSNENSAEIKLDSEGEPITPRSEKKINKKIILLIAVILIIIGSGTVYFLFLNKADDNKLPIEENTEVSEDQKEVEIDKELDTDQDGLPDYIEKVLGTDENSADTDGDTYSDFDEIKNGYNPLNDERLAEEEWEEIKKRIKGENERLFGEMFFSSLVGEMEVLTIAGDLEYWMQESVSLVENVAIMITSDNLDNFEKKVIEEFENNRQKVIVRTASEVSKEELGFNNLMLTGNLDTNNLIAEIYEKVSVVNVIDITDDINGDIVKTTVKLADSPWNKDKKIIMLDSTHLAGSVISIKGKIKVEKKGNYYRISLDDNDKIYALVLNENYSEDNNILQYDGKNVEISGYKRISSSTKLQFEDSIGVMDIKVVD